MPFDRHKKNVIKNVLRKENIFNTERLPQQREPTAEINEQVRLILKRLNILAAEAQEKAERAECHYS